MNIAEEMGRFNIDCPHYPMRHSAPYKLETNETVIPLGIDRDQLVFRWRFPSKLAKPASLWQLQVSATASGFSTEKAGVWDSGIQEGSSGIALYRGAALLPSTRYYWRVRVAAQEARWSKWSRLAWFETGLRHEDWRASWIAAPKQTTHASAEPLVRRTFHLEQPPRRARLYVSGLGYYVAYINNTRVGDRVLEPAFRDYCQRVPYSSLECSDLLVRGVNVVAVELGRGWYAMASKNYWQWHNAAWTSDRPHLRAQLLVELRDGTRREIVTDGSWKTAVGPTQFDSLYEGERFDARLRVFGWAGQNYDDDHWHQAEVVAGPSGRMTPQEVQSMRIMDQIRPVSIVKTGSDLYRFDFGAVVAGWAELRARARKGLEIELLYGEKLDSDGRILFNNRKRVDGKLQSDTYCFATDRLERWEPMYSYKGFRYVELRGLPSRPTANTLTAKVVHTAVESGMRSKFRSSDRLLNQIHAVSRRTLLNTLHSIPTDTPTYEKNGWLADAEVSCRAAMYNFDMRRFYRKWLDDIADAQRPSGELPVIAPTSGWGYFSGDRRLGIEDLFRPEWYLTYVLLPWQYYRFYGDASVLERHYEGMKRLFQWLSHYAHDDLLPPGHGDHLPPKYRHANEGGVRIDGEAGSQAARKLNPAFKTASVTANAYYYHAVDLLARIANILGRSEDEVVFSQKRRDIGIAFNHEFLDKDAGLYRTEDSFVDYRQTANLLPLAFGIVPEEIESIVIERLAEDVVRTRENHLNTGILGTRHLFEVLSEREFVDTAFSVAKQTTYPSYGYWFEAGINSVLESWELDARSRNHAEFGAAVDSWFFSHLAGIRPGAPGFATVRIEPHIPVGLASVAASVETVRGVVRVSWRQKNGNGRLDIRLPGNTEAIVKAPNCSGLLMSLLRSPVARTAQSPPPSDDRGTHRIGQGHWQFAIRAI